MSSRGRGRGRRPPSNEPNSNSVRGPPRIVPSEGIEPPPLYPPINPIPRPKITSKDEFLLRKNAHIKRRYFSSPYHLSKEQDQKFGIGTSKFH